MALRPHSRWIVPLVIAAMIAGIWWMRRRPPEYPFAYIGDRAAILWSTTAQVRRPVTTLHYGQRVAILRRTGDQAQVRSDDGLEGWLDARLLMSPALWQQTADILRQVAGMPVQAAGHTRARSNVHITPGRDAPVVFQFGAVEPVAVFSRKAVGVPRPGDAAAADDADKDAAPPDAKSPADKTEDWLLVLRAQRAGAAAAATPGGFSAGSAGADTGVSGPIAGWVLAQFVVLDPPGPIADYTSAAGMRVVAWAVLNKVADGGGDKPQYLVAAAASGQPKACDFAGLRVYTWGTQRQRYETAYVENGLCGQMPIRTAAAPDGAEFRFREADESGAERVYRMNQTVVRRVREAAPAPGKRR